MQRLHIVKQKHIFFLKTRLHFIGYHKPKIKLSGYFFLDLYCISYAAIPYPLPDTWEAYSNGVAALFICRHFRLYLNHNFFSTNCRISYKLYRTVDHHEIIHLTNHSSPQKSWTHFIVSAHLQGTMSLMMTSQFSLTNK